MTPCLPQRLAAATGAAVLAALLASCGSDSPAASPHEGASHSSSEAAGRAAGQDVVHNAADVEFAQGMVVHHRGALEMAELATSRAESAEVKDLAGRIAAAQEPEIETMTAWLEEWGEDVPEGTTMAGGDGHGDGHGGDMAQGMAEDVQGLRGATGADFDRTFLEAMTVHHEDAVEMSRTEQADGQDPGAVELAGTIEADQTAEIEQMQQMLQAL